MKTVDITNCTGDIHFPIIRALPAVKKKSFFKRIFNFVTYRRKWEICKDYCLWVPSLSSWIFLPERFVFDGASIPKLLNNIFSPTGMLLFGAAPHDFGYRYEGLIQIDHEGNLQFISYSKKELDNIFKHLCAYESGMNKASSVATATLRVAGFVGWKENRKANCVLRDDFPELFVFTKE